MRLLLEQLRIRTPTLFVLESQLMIRSQGHRLKTIVTNDPRPRNTQVFAGDAKLLEGDAENLARLFDYCDLATSFSGEQMPQRTRLLESMLSWTTEDTTITAWRGGLPVLV